MPTPSSFLKKVFAIALSSCIVFIAGISVVSAQTGSREYTPLAPLYLPDNQQLPTDLAGFVITGFRLAVAASAALAIIVIIYGGIQYMATDLVFKKGQAKNTIQQALLGLLLVMTSYLVLYTVNPKLVDISLITSDFKPHSSSNTNTPQNTNVLDQKVITNDRPGETGNTPLQQYSFKDSKGVRHNVTGLKTEDLNTLGDNDFYSINFIKSNTEYYTDTLAECQGYDQTHVVKPCSPSGKTTFWLMCNGATWCTNGERATGDDYATLALCQARVAQEPGKLSCLEHAYGYTITINNGIQTEKNLTLGACNYYKSTWSTQNPGQTTSECTKANLQ